MGHNPNWIIQSGPIGKQVTNFEGNTGFDQGNAVTLDNGNILMAGTTDGGQFGFVRYVVDPGQSDDGNPDTTFGDSGLVTTPFPPAMLRPAPWPSMAPTATSLWPARRGRQRAYEVALARYHEADGSLDTTFGTGGLVTTELGTDWTSTDAVAVESDGNILVAGNSHRALCPPALLFHRDEQTNFGSASGGVVTADFGGTNETPSAMTMTRQRQRR